MSIYSAHSLVLLLLFHLTDCKITDLRMKKKKVEKKTKLTKFCVTFVKKKIFFFQILISEIYDYNKSSEKKRKEKTTINIKKKIFFSYSLTFLTTFFFLSLYLLF